MTVTANSGELVPFRDSLDNSGHRSTGEPRDLLDLRELWKLLRSNARPALAIFAATILAAIIYLLVVPPTYTAVSVIHIDPRQQRVIKSEAVLSGIGADAAAVESQVELMKSTAMARAVIEQLGLTNDPEFTSPSLLGSALKAMLPDWGKAGTEAAAELERNKVIARFQDQLGVQRRGLTYIIEVKFSSVDAEKSARIANAVSDAYLTDQLAIKHNAATSASIWLTGRIDEMREKVRASERAVADFKAANKIVDVGVTDSGLTLNNRQLVEFNQQLILARARAAEAKAKYDQVLHVASNKVDPGSLPDALNSDVIARLRVQYSDVARIESEYSATYGPAHPDLQRVRSQLGRLHREIKEELARILASSKNEYEIAKSRVESLTGSLNELEQQSAQLNQEKVRLAELQREAEANRQLFEQFLARAKETGEQRNLNTTDARIVARAIVPVEPTSPKKLMLLIVAAFAGAGLAVGGVLVRHKLQRGYRSKTDLEYDTGHDCLALCPVVSPRDAGAKGRLHRQTGKNGSALRPRGAGSRGLKFEHFLQRMCLDQPDSRFAEAIRSVRLGCLAGKKDGSNKIVLVSSALPREGKSTIAANLARSLAKNGVYTLLIDADRKVQTLSQSLTLPGAPGLAEVLVGAARFQDAAVFDEECGLMFLPAGNERASGANGDVLFNDALADFLNVHRDNFDCIVIDGPPILGNADARIMHRYVDAALLVVAWGETDRNAVLNAVGDLDPMGDKILGTVLNKVDPKALDAYPYY